MAGAVSCNPLQRRALAHAALAIGLASAPAWALGPLAPFTPPLTAAAAAAAASSAAGDAAGAPGAAQAATGLSGVRLARSGTQALIDGQWWPLGSAPRGARLVAVRSGQALLRQADGRIETLTLHPVVAVATPAAAARHSTPATPVTGSTR